MTASPLFRIRYDALAPGDVIAQYAERYPVLAVGLATVRGCCGTAADVMVAPLVVELDGTAGAWLPSYGSEWVDIEPRPAGPRLVCDACRHRHITAADARACHNEAAEWERYAAAEGHVCESPSCVVERGCVGFRYDSAANGYWGAGEEAAERQAWALEDEAAAQRGLPAV